MKFDITPVNHLTFIRTPPGEFLVGSDNPLYPESPAHVVRFESCFELARSPITQEQWEAVMPHNPSSIGSSRNHPVDGVSWDQATEFCMRLSDRLGVKVQLPSEAQWEYACRAGSTGDFFFGPWKSFLDETDIPHAMHKSAQDYAWLASNSAGKTYAVGAKAPNPWDLHDMIGNVWEWCQDVWHGDYSGSPNDGNPWVKDADRQPRRSLRGGAWDMDAFRCRSPYRSYEHKNIGTNRFGLRVVIEC